MTEPRRCAAPDPTPKRPDILLPPGACDSHCHVFGPADRFPYHPDRKYTPPDAPFDRLRALHAFLGFDRAVLVQATCHGDDNRALLDGLAKGEGAYRGVAMIGPEISDDDLAAMDAAGVRGARFAFARHVGDVPSFGVIEEAATRIAPLGWHIELYLEAPDLIELADRVAALAAPVVLDHMARIDPSLGLEQEAFRVLLDLATGGPEIWVKLSCPERLSKRGYPYADVMPFARAMIEAAPGRALWGTDWPHPNRTVENMPNDGRLVDLIAEMAPDVAARQALLVDNPARFYGFEIAGSTN